MFFIVILCSFLTVQCEDINTIIIRYSSDVSQKRFSDTPKSHEKNRYANEYIESNAPIFNYDVNQFTDWKKFIPNYNNVNMNSWQIIIPQEPNTWNGQFDNINNYGFQNYAPRPQHEYWNMQSQNMQWMSFGRPEPSNHPHLNRPQHQHPPVKPIGFDFDRPKPWEQPPRHPNDHRDPRPPPLNNYDQSSGSTGFDVDRPKPWEQPPRHPDHRHPPPPPQNNYYQPAGSTGIDFDRPKPWHPNDNHFPPPHNSDVAVEPTSSEELPEQDATTKTPEDMSAPVLPITGKPPQVTTGSTTQSGDGEDVYDIDIRSGFASDE